MKRTTICALLVLFLASMPLWAQGAEPYSIKVDPVADINPVKTQHTLVATVLDREGNPLPNQRVEWLLSRGPQCVGDIVDHDDKGAIVGGQKVEKLANNYSVSYTNEASRTLDMGTPTPNDDIEVGVGQTWCTITSPVEGETHIIAFCPAIRNANNHKTFAIKYWIDAQIEWPQNAINRVGEPHTFEFRLVKASNQTPLPGYQVHWELLNEGPAAYIGDSEDSKKIETATNEEGVATVTLTQLETNPGSNTIRVELRRPNGELLAVRKATKKWISPSLDIAKTGPAEGIVGENVTYTIEVKNPGDAEARGVQVKDITPADFTYQSSSIEPISNVGGEITWDLGSIEKNETKRFTVTFRANAPGDKVNVAQVYSDRGAGPEAKAITKIGQPELYIIKEGPPEIRLGEVANYKITIKNRGSAIAKDVLIRDEVPDGMDYRGRKTGFALRWNVGTLAPNEEKSYTYKLQTTRVGTFENVAKAIMGRRTVHKTTFVTRVIAPDLSITKTSNSRVIFLRRPASFTITVTNSGTADALDATLEDVLPPQLEYVSSDPPGAFRPGQDGNPSQVFWKLGDIKPGESKEVKLEIRGIKQGVTRNTAKVTSEGRTYDAFADLRIEGVSAMHLSTYDTEDPVEVGNQTVYVIEARNEGTNPCTNVKLEDQIPEEMEFVKAEGPTDFVLEGNTVKFTPHPILKPGDKLVYRVICRAIQEGSAKNRAILTYDQFDKPILDEEGTSVYK